MNEAHNEWRDRPADERYQTLSELTTAVSARKSAARESIVETNRLSIVAIDDELIVQSLHTEMSFTNWSFSQLATRVGAPAGFLRKLPAPLAAQNLSHMLARDNERVKLYTVGERVQAVTSDTYGRIYDADVCEMVRRIVERSGGAFHNPLAYDPLTHAPTPSGLYASDHDVFLFLIDGGSKLEEHGARPGALNRGFMVWNSEVGAATLGIQSFLFREVCGNHIVWGASNVRLLKIRHTSGGPERFLNEAWPLLSEYIEHSPGPEKETIDRAQAFKLAGGMEIVGSRPQPNAERTAWLMAKGFTKPEIKDAANYAVREEGGFDTLWQGINGFTASARDLTFADSRVDLERRAGRLLQLVATN